MKTEAGIAVPPDSSVIQRLHHSASAFPRRLLIAADRYFKRDDVGIVYQLAVAPRRGAGWSGRRCCGRSSRGRRTGAGCTAAGARRTSRRTGSGSRWGSCRWRSARGRGRRGGCTSSGSGGPARGTRPRRGGSPRRRTPGRCARTGWCCRSRRGGIGRTSCRQCWQRSGVRSQRSGERRPGGVFPRPLPLSCPARSAARRSRRPGRGRACSSARRGRSRRSPSSSM